MDENSIYFADDESGYGSEYSIIDELNNELLANAKENNENVYDQDWITKTQGAMYSLLYSRLLSKLDQAAKRGELMVRRPSGKRAVK